MKTLGKSKHMKRTRTNQHPKTPAVIQQCAKILIVRTRGGKRLKRSGRHYRNRSSGQRPHRCRSMADRHPYCRGRRCAEGSRASASASDSPRCRGGRSSRRCHRTASVEASSSGVPCHGCREQESSSVCIQRDRVVPRCSFKPESDMNDTYPS